MPASSDSVSPIDNEGSFSHSSHDITLQRLDTLLPYAGVASGKLKYNVDNFAGTEQAWDRTLAVFVPDGVPAQHVDHAAFARDPHGEARRLGFRVVGHHSDTKVISNGPGEPRIITKAVFTDPEVDQLATEGKLSLSTGFDAHILPEGGMKGTVSPNHVLYFLRNHTTAFGTPASPNDPGAYVNNLEETMADDETKGMIQSIKDMLAQKENPLTGTVDNLNAEVTKRDAKIDALTKENESLKAAKVSLDNLMEEQATKAKDAKWMQVKNLLKPGLYHKPEDEKALRDAFESDAATFMIANIGNLQTAKAMPAQGVAAVGNLGEDETKPFDVAAARGRMNPLTGRFE
jgi:hypothetical protein